MNRVFQIRADCGPLASSIGLARGDPGTGRRAPRGRGRACKVVLAAAVLLASCAYALAAEPASPEPLYLIGIPVDFILFGVTLLGVALFHRHTLPVALAGLAAIVGYKLAFPGFRFGP